MCPVKTQHSSDLISGEDRTGLMLRMKVSSFFSCILDRFGVTGVYDVVCVPDDKQLANLAEACWSKVISERQRMLEEHYKMEISASHVTGKPTRMVDVSPLWEEMARDIWLLHTGFP